MTTARDELPEANQTAPAVGIRLDRTVRPLIEKLRAMQRPGAESDLTVMCAEAADALTELMEWRKLRDPVTLHVSLLRGLPAQLDRATFLHCAGADQLMQALQEADTIMGHDDAETEWRNKWAGLWPNAKSQATDAALSRQVACTDGLGLDGTEGNT